MNSNIKRSLAFLAMLSLPLVSSAAFGDSDLIAKIEISGGMPGPDGFESELISIYDNGSVVSEVKTTSYDGQESTVKFSKRNSLSRADVHALQTNIAKIDATRDSAANILKGNYDDTFMCMDAPMIEFSILKNGKSVVVATDEGCYQYSTLQNKNEWIAALNLKKLLVAALYL
ncbi:MAG: hypothetical protein KDD22_02130 [Bdellovibrionales bacterium]|nr:hypothetical protein [Bdellovibrionales bacterium]